MRTIRRKVFFSTVVAAAIQVLIPGTAHAASEFTNVATLLCLDSNWSGSVYTMGCNSGNYQRWNLYFNSYGIEMRNVATNRCLDSNTSGHTYTLGCNGGNYQRWRHTYVSNGGGSWRMTNVSTLRCLDSNAAGNTYTLGCNGGNFQHWYRRSL
ncbi:ricin-type beta-trefoil lectin domain protein [Chitinimonas arctica]|uniref:Ricin-type beta-trefoil lectin domain protein n=1 Tax=Chitinimonas arctica TaxID=2594795 RepID=A0A516SLD2_9NEIS|nr:ricin-type beta-trefoil lectin domain protein [Chitinimonas arctica]QDQ28969.1 ricin-type beta-trefoil lectin domain protein [Chitinimonas arctica]